jgi:hypothetical protein
MLPVGAIRQCENVNNRTRFTQDEQITMMTLWCMMRSPLMIGGELTKNDDFTLRLLTNAAALEMLTATHCAHPLYTTADSAVWLAPRTDGEGLYLALFNLTDAPLTLRQETAELGMADCTAVTELWTGQTAEPGEAVTAALPTHGAQLYRLSR